MKIFVVFYLDGLDILPTISRKF